MNREQFGEIRNKFVVTQPASLFEKYPSTAVARLVFHKEIVGEVRMDEGQDYRCPLRKYNQVSFVTMTAVPVVLDFPNKFVSSDKLPVAVVGDVELAVKQDADSILSLTLRFEEQFEKLTNRIAATLGQLCAEHSGHEIVAGQAEAVSRVKAIDLRHVPFEIADARIALEVPLLKEKIASQAINSVEFAEDLKRIDVSQRLNAARLEAERATKTAMHNLTAEEDARRRAIEMARFEDELKRAEQKAASEAKTEESRLAVTRAKLAVIKNNKFALGLIDPTGKVLAEINRHEEEMARAASNLEAVQIAEERILQTIERLLAAVSKTPSVPPIIFT